jgi:hypothetical protein
LIHIRVYEIIMMTREIKIGALIANIFNITLGGEIAEIAKSNAIIHVAAMPIMYVPFQSVRCLNGKYTAYARSMATAAKPNTDAIPNRISWILNAFKGMSRTKFNVTYIGTDINPTRRSATARLTSR